MARTIPCTMCEATPALFLVTFTPNGDTVGLGPECVNTWAEQVMSVMGPGDKSEVPQDVECFKVTAIPTGDILDLTVAGIAEWAEDIARALDAQAASEASGGAAEPITRPGAPKRPRRPKRGPSGPISPPPDLSDAEWEASGAAGRPQPPDAPTAEGGPGPGVAEGEPPATADAG